MSFWKEIKRRNVVKVGIAYAIVAWLIIHPVDIIFPTLHLPEWTTTFVTALFIIAFPFKKYIKRIGLVDYWNKFGWPDMCHKLDNGDFECD